MRTVKAYVVTVERGVKQGRVFRFVPLDGSDAARRKAQRSACNKVDRLDAEYGACCAHLAIWWDGDSTLG